MPLGGSGRLGSKRVAASRQLVGSAGGSRDLRLAQCAGGGWGRPGQGATQAVDPSLHRSVACAEVAAKKAELAARKEERRKAQAELQARKRMLGNIVFVGQLFK